MRPYKLKFSRYWNDDCTVTAKIKKKIQRQVRHLLKREWKKEVLKEDQDLK